MVVSILAPPSALQAVARSGGPGSCLRCPGLPGLHHCCPVIAVRFVVAVVAVLLLVVLLFSALLAIVLVILVVLVGVPLVAEPARSPCSFRGLSSCCCCYRQYINKIK